MEFVGSLVDIADGDDVGAFVECGKVHHLLIIYCCMSYIQALLLLAMQSPPIMPHGALFIRFTLFLNLRNQTSRSIAQLSHLPIK